MKTIGWELSLGWNDRLENGLSYWVKGVLSDYQATITKYAGNDAGFYSQSDDDGKYYVGNRRSAKSGGIIQMVFSNRMLKQLQQTKVSFMQVNGVPVM